jgi:pyruvyltransferase
LNALCKFFLAIAIVIVSLTENFIHCQEGLPLFWWKEGPFVNFGDYISYKMVERIVGQPLLSYNKRSPHQMQKLLASGSIFYFANEGDVVWGSGINGLRMNKKDYLFNSLSVRSVRGPLTRAFLKRNFNIIAPEIYGDPALLFPYLFPEFKRKNYPKHEYVVIIHFRDIPYFINDDQSYLVHATEPWDVIIKAILNSKFVISSALHGIIIAESYGIPARLLRIGDSEPLFKFVDYYEGTGRNDFNYATSIEDALLMGGEPPAKCDLEQLYNAFPFEFWPNRQFPTINFILESS